MDREKVIKEYEDFVNGYECFCASDDYEYEMHKAVLALLKDEKEYCNNCAESAIKTTVELQEEIARLRSLLKEQEETELCDRCGRRRLKSNREVK